jgi:molecular chaperone DnaJ
MTAGFDPYAVLGVSRDATGEQIAQARHQLVRRYHPDLNPAPDAAARFDEVQHFVIPDTARRNQ